ncbi:MAG: RraA family protein [Bryobacteraceae bacterium]|nr:RraA family protein [Bryobacteraceae bacterium]
MSLWQNDQELFALARRELFSAVLGDVMDKLGLLRQFLPPDVRPVRPEMVLVGRAMTVLESDCVDLQRGPAAQPFGLMLEALDSLQPGEIYVTGGPAGHYAHWGELMSTRALRLGAVGAVLHGYHRDTNGILALDFPTFSLGAWAQDQAPRGRVVDYRVPVDVGQARIAPGDILFGDRDGVCVIPRAAEADVFRLALEKARGEQTVRQAIEGGMSAVDAFAKYGIL